MNSTGWRSRVAAAFAVILLPTAAARADDIRVMTSGAFTAPYLELGREFEQSTGHRLVTAATSMGTGPSSIETRLGRGEAIDVVIVAAAALEQLIRAGSIVPGSRVDLARSGIGMAVRRGSPKPDISSVEALKRTLLAARSIAYSSSVSGTYLSTELFQKLGIADQVLPKSRRVETERVGAVVARGEAEIGFQQISELLPEAGIDFVAPLPADVQRVTVFSAGIGTAATHPDAAKLLIGFLASAGARPTIRRTGLEPVMPNGDFFALTTRCGIRIGREEVHYGFDDADHRNRRSRVAVRRRWRVLRQSSGLGWTALWRRTARADCDYPAAAVAHRQSGRTWTATATSGSRDRDRHTNLID